MAEGSSSFVQANTLPSTPDWSPAGKQVAPLQAHNNTGSRRPCWPSATDWCAVLWAKELAAEERWGELSRLGVYYSRTPCLEKQKFPTFLTWVWRTIRGCVCFVTWKAAHGFSEQHKKWIPIGTSQWDAKIHKEKRPRSIFFPFSHCEWERRDMIFHVTAREFVL